MRRVFQFDGLNGGVLSVGECLEPERLALCITSNDGHEAQMLIGSDEWYALINTRYEIKIKHEEPEEEKPKAELRAVE
jgi:hypothetical protein